MYIYIYVCVCVYNIIYIYIIMTDLYCHMAEINIVNQHCKAIFLQLK